MSAIFKHFVLGVFLSVVTGLLLWGGYAPNTNTVTEQIPTSVRDNPASYRPIYTGYTGWSPRTTGSGGYSYGK